MNTSIIILSDKKLSDLDKELRSLVTHELGNLTSFLKRIDEIDENEKFDDIEMQLDRVEEFSATAHFLIRDMKLRLDKLAQKIP